MLPTPEAASGRLERRVCRTSSGTRGWRGSSADRNVGFGASLEVSQSSDQSCGALQPTAS
jgi:hypothetical protein